MAFLVCIDPGHAKSTAGKRSFDEKLREYEFNRDVAKRLKGLLEQHGVKTMYSCDIEAEKDLYLSGRCANANNAGADLFFSIHANAYGTTWNSANGWSIFHCEGSVKGKSLAKAVQAASIPELGLRDRGIKTSNFTVLVKTKMPAVLVEHGFYTNKDEVKKLLSSDFREKCAVADAKGILSYLGIKWKGGEAESTSEKAEKHSVEVQVTVLRVNDQSGSVKALQILLNGLGYPCGDADGIFGTKTLVAVKAFQNAKGLAADGIVGVATWGALLS